MPFHYLDSLLILDAVFWLLSEPFENIESIFSATLNCPLNQKFHSAHFSAIGLANKKGLLLQKHIFLFRTLNPLLLPSQCLLCVCVPIPISFVLPLTLLSFLLHLQTSWSRVLLLASADPLGIVCLEQRHEDVYYS